jgi:transposase
MGKPYSEDLRKRVVAAVVTDGLSWNAAAKKFGVAVSTAIGWQAEGDFRRTPSLGVLERVKRDFTLRGLVAELAERGLKVDYQSVWKFVHAEKLSFKKSVVAGERDRPDVARRRAQWLKYQDRVEAERLVFIDETWTRTDMAALRDGHPAARSFPPKFHTAAGRPGPSWRPCAMTPSRRHDLSRAQSTATASASTSRRSFSRRFVLATSWSWTISVATEAKPYVSSFAP